MNVRILQQHELLPALRLVWEVFVKEVAPFYDAEGVEEFQKFITYENIEKMHQRGEITIFGAYEDEELLGVMAVKRMGHICLFYVKEEHQGKGTGRMLFEEVKKFCFLSQRVNKITVNAALGAAAKYEKMGFKAVAEEKVEKGIRFLPMEMEVSAREIDKPSSSKKPWIIAGIVAGVLLISAVVIVATALIVTGVKRYSNSFSNYDYNYEYDGDGLEDDIDKFEDGFNNELEGELTGIDAIESYEADNLTYEIKEEEYQFEDKERKNTTIQFEVQYPKLEGLDSAIADKVNQELKACAMETVDKIYTNPSDEIKEGVLNADNPALMSYVRYKVTYASENFISVVYEDYSYQGSLLDSKMDLRTRNISLKDGAVYEVKDIITVNPSFLAEFRSIMQGEAGDSKFLSELKDDDMKKTLEGDTLNGVYVANFFVHAKGIEIGYDLNYPSGDANDFGYVWVTAPFDMNKIKAYQSSSKMWDEIK